MRKKWAAGAKELDGRHAADAIFATYQRWGVAAIKPGFVPTGSQQNKRVVAELVKKAAARKLLLKTHDSHFPDSLPHTYPNLLNPTSDTEVEI